STSYGTGVGWPNYTDSISETQATLGHFDCSSYPAFTRIETNHCSPLSLPVSATLYKGLEDARTRSIECARGKTTFAKKYGGTRVWISDQLLSICWGNTSFRTRTAVDNSSLCRSQGTSKRGFATKRESDEFP